MEHAHHFFMNKRSLFSKPIYTLKKAIKPFSFYIKSRTVANTFFNHFEISSNLSAKDKEAMAMLRYQVYCNEMNFQFSHQNNMETDTYDEHSDFCAVKHSASQELVGSVRLVKSNSDSQRLPIEDTCKTFFKDCTHLPQHFKRSEIGEISRLVVAASHRKKMIKRHITNKNAVNMSNFADAQTMQFENKSELCSFKYIAVSLYIGATVLCLRHKIKHVYLITTPSLARSLSRFGIQLTRIGHAFEYSGLRAPYYIDAVKTKKKIHGGFGRMLKVIQNNMD